MDIIVNGETQQTDEGATVKSLLESLGLNPAEVVVQRNDDILERARYAETPLAQGDKLELVRLVGGG